MSIIDQTSDSGYKDSQGERVTMADVLQKLKEELKAQRITLADAKLAIQHLELAIGAIERNQAETKRRIEHQRPTVKRGYLSRAVIEAIRDGIGTASAIVSHLAQQGITTAQPSVSNAINRLQGKKQIHYDLKLRRWVLTANTGSIDEDGANKVSAPDVLSGAVIQAVG
jgi:hypothetical protein